MATKVINTSRAPNRYKEIEEIIIDNDDDEQEQLLYNVKNLKIFSIVSIIFTYYIKHKIYNLKNLIHNYVKEWTNSKNIHLTFYCYKIQRNNSTSCF